MALASFVLPMASSCFCKAQVIERPERQAHENIDAVRQHPQCISECKPHFRLGTGRRRRIGYAPMRGHRLTRPNRAGFFRSVVADGEHEIELRRVWSRELLPALRTQSGHVVVQLSQQIERVRDALGLSAGFRPKRLGTFLVPLD